jgi:predicted RNA-binding Zn-ribbon protein involved in translation (DUF1610 family)
MTEPDVSALIPCRRVVRAGTIVATACPDCGHANILHPSSMNPALDECLVCVMTLKIDLWGLYTEEVKRDGE